MADKCKLVRKCERAPRPFDDKSAARVCCYAIREGATWAGIQREARERGCLDKGEAQCDCARLQAIIKLYEAMTAAALVILAILIPATAVLSRAKVLNILRQMKLPKREMDALEDAAKKQKQIVDTRNSIEGNFRVLKDDPALKPGVIIREP